MQSDTTTPTFREPRFSHDFSRIPIHPPAASAIQTKLAISKPGDEYEQEADRIADQVMTVPTPHSVSGAPPRIQRFSGQSNGRMDTVPHSVDQALASPGRPLEPELRQDMEQRFGHDFSRVRVHSGAVAEQSAQDVNAHAYTVGHDIVFGTGRFAPGTHEGRRLIAHELTHVVQQQVAEGQRMQRQMGDPTRFKRVPPGPGAYTAAEHEDWERRYPKSIFEREWETNPSHGEYTPEWFWARGYFYARTIYGGYQGARLEIWLSNEGPGHEYRLWREAKKEAGTSPVRTETTDPNIDPDVEEAQNYIKDRAAEKNKLIHLVEELHKKIGTAEYNRLYAEYRRMEDQWLNALEDNRDRVDELARSSDDDNNRQKLRDASNGRTPLCGDQT